MFARFVVERQLFVAMKQINKCENTRRSQYQHKSLNPIEKSTEILEHNFEQFNFEITF